MASKVFLDANVLLDLTLKREYYLVSKKIFGLAVNGDIEAYTTPAIVHIIAYWLTKAYGKQKTKELILYILDDVRVIDCNHEITLTAINSSIEDIEDALQYYTGIQHKLDYFLTRDRLLKKMAVHTLPIYTPEDFLKEVVYL